MFLVQRKLTLTVELTHIYSSNILVYYINELMVKWFGSAGRSYSLVRCRVLM